MADYGNETSRISDLIRQYRDEPLQDIGDVAEEEKSQDQSKRATDLSEYMDKYKTKMEEGGEEIGGGVLLEGGRKIYGRARTLYKKYKEATRNNQTKKEFKPKDKKSDPQAENEEPAENPEGFSEDTAPPEVGDAERTFSEPTKFEPIKEEEEGEEETDPDPTEDFKFKANSGDAEPTTGGSDALPKGFEEDEMPKMVDDDFIPTNKSTLEDIPEEEEPDEPKPSSEADDSGGGEIGEDATDSTRVFGEGTSSGRVVGNPSRDAGADADAGGSGGGSAGGDIGGDVAEPEGYAPELFGAGGGSEADSIASRVGGSILDTFKSRGAGIFQKYQDAKNFIQRGASELGGDGASAGTTAGGEAIGETAGAIGGEAIGGAVAGGVAEAVVGAIPVLGEIALVGVGLVKFGEAIYHLFHPKHDKAKVINAPQNIAMPTASQQLTSKYAQAMPSIDTASDVSASVMSF